MNVVSSFVGIHCLQIAQMPHHVKLVGNTIAAMLRWQCGSQESRGTEFAHDGDVEGATAIRMHDARRKLAARVLAGAVAYRAFVIAQQAFQLQGIGLVELDALTHRPQTPSWDQ